MSERLAQRVAVVGTIDANNTAGTTTCDIIDASLYDSLMFVLAMGTFTSSGRIAMTVYKGTVPTTASITSSVTSAVLSCTGTGGLSDCGEQAIIDIDVSNEGSYRYYKAQLSSTALGTGTYYNMVVLGSKARFHPASDDDLASVKSITLA